MSSWGANRSRTKAGTASDAESNSDTARDPSAPPSCELIASAPSAPATLQPLPNTAVAQGWAATLSGKQWGSYRTCATRIVRGQERELRAKYDFIALEDVPAALLEGAQGDPQPLPMTAPGWGRDGPTLLPAPRAAAAGWCPAPQRARPCPSTPHTGCCTRPARGARGRSVSRATQGSGVTDIMEWRSRTENSRVTRLCVASLSVLARLRSTSNGSSMLHTGVRVE